jgi:hypothetical protein
MSPSIQDPTSGVPKKSSSVISRRNPDGTFALMHLEQEEHLFSLDGIAAEFWDLMDSRRSLEQIKRLLIQKHSPPLKRFELDLSKLIKSLRKADLISFEK